MRSVNSKEEYVSASIEEVGLNPADYPLVMEHIPKICKKTKGIYSRLRNAPKDIERKLIWHAMSIAIHQANWGNLAAWREEATIALMRAR